MDREMKRVRGSTLDQAPLNRSGIMEKYWKLTLAQTTLSSVVPIRGCGSHLRYMGTTKDVEDMKGYGGFRLGVQGFAACMAIQHRKVVQGLGLRVGGERFGGVGSRTVWCSQEKRPRDYRM